MPYDTLRDFTGVSLISASTYLLVTHPGVPFKAVKELIAAAKAEPGYEFYAWFGLLAPAKTPTPVLRRIHDALYKALRAPETTSQFEAQGADAVGNSPEEFTAFLRREYDKYASVVKASGLRVD